MRILWFTVSIACCLVPAVGESRGVSPYLPLQLSPRIERQIERVLILAGKPVMRRPIAAAVVLDALPVACRVDRVACDEVRAYLQAYMQPFAVTTLRASAAGTDGDSGAILPNRRGESVDSPWRVEANAFYQPTDYIVLNAGGVAYDGDAFAAGSFLSLGFDFAQLDVGFREHWLSPFNDSSSSIATEAPTMPSITLSNYEPISRLGISYEMFMAEMSEQSPIPFEGGFTEGKPRLAGFQGVLEPVPGYAVGISRIAQYGGGARGGTGFSDFVDALLENSNALGDAAGATNRIAALTSSILFPGKVPLGVHLEYAGEDNAYKGNKLLGATNFSLGVDLPRLWNDFDLSVEMSEWQNDWYVHYLYPQGLTNDDHVIAHWFGSNRVFGDAIGGSSQMLRLGWHSGGGWYWGATYRTLMNDTDWRRAGNSFASVTYERMQMLELSVSGLWRDREIAAALTVGEDVFGDSFARLGASIDFAPRSMRAQAASAEEVSGNSGVDFFVDVGAFYNEVKRILAVDIPNVTTPWSTTAHLGVGVRRRVSERNDLGVRIEFDQDVDGYLLTSFRALDYRFRWTPRLAFGAFFGAGRYDIRLPAYGYYWGFGLQYLDILPKWDVSVDARHHEKLGRDKTTLPEDPPSSPERTRMFFDVNGLTLSVSRRF